MIHMVDQIRELGPLYLHEMWTYERFMSIIDRYILNRAYPEGFMIEGYSTEEVIECCLAYLNDKVSICLPVPCFFWEVGRGWDSWEEKNLLIRILKECNKHIIASCSISR